MYYLRSVEKVLHKDKQTGKVYPVEICIHNACIGLWYNKILPNDESFPDIAKKCGEKPKDLCCIIISEYNISPFPIMDYMTFRERYPIDKGEF